MSDLSPQALGNNIRAARKQRGLTQAQLAELINTSQSAVNRMEAGGQNLSIEMVNRIARAIDYPLLSASNIDSPNLRIQGGFQLHGAIDTRTSKNGSVAVLCATLLNRGTTTLKGIARIEEVNRIIEVLESIGVVATWSDDQTELVLRRPETLDLANMDIAAARRTRSFLMCMPTLAKEFNEFRLPYAGGCDLGSRTIEPHLQALRHYGLLAEAHDGYYACSAVKTDTKDVAYTMIERGDVATENAILAAAQHEGTSLIRNASPNYMVQDLCFFLEELGVKIEGIGTTTLTITGQPHVNKDVVYSPSEDPIEAFSMLTAAIMTKSELMVRRVPIEFIEVEMALLEVMGLDWQRGDEYFSHNGKTRLVDIVVKPSQLRAPYDKIHPMPFPGLNIDNLPQFAVIAACAQGKTLIHDWVFENRAIHMMEMQKLGAHVQLLDPHRIIVDGPTRWKGADLVVPAALRPAVCLVWAGLAAEGETVLRQVYVINRGYEELPARLNSIGADVSVFRD